MYNSAKKPRNLGMDKIKFRGEITVKLYDRWGNLLDDYESENFIVNLGLETVIDILDGTSLSYRIFRMAVGDDGTLSGQPYVPKTTDSTWPSKTGLFHEVIRKNIDSNTQPISKSMRFLTTFASADITPSSFTSSPRVLNEASLIISDGTQTGNNEIPQGYTPDASEKMLSIRTFKSMPFDPADTLTLAVGWTIYAQ
jgi:hypothetical protein